MIGFVGLTHLGIIYSLATAAKGFQAVAFDPDVELVTGLNDGNFPVSEPGLVEGWRENRTRLRYTSKVSDLSDCSLVFFSLDVSTDEKHQSNLQPLRDLIALTIPALANGTTVVLLNQVPPGFTREVRREYQAICAERQIEIIYQVETLVFGQAVARAIEPERYIIGLANQDDPIPVAYLDWLSAFSCPCIRMRLESAELAKTAINFFLVSTVTTTNFLAQLCEGLGADWSEIVPALKLDKRIGPHAYLRPGLGISGGNLPRDLVTLRRLSADNGLPTNLIDTWVRESDFRRDWVLRHVQKAGLNAGKLAVWGLAYIANTASTKNSAGVALLHALPDARKTAYDPQVKSLPEETPPTRIAASPLEALDGADALCIMTPWAEFSGVPIAEIAKRLTGQLVLDPLGVLDESAARAAGLSHFRLGQP